MEMKVRESRWLDANILSFVVAADRTTMCVCGGLPGQPKETEADCLLVDDQQTC